MSENIKSIVFLKPSPTASLRTKRRIEDYGGKGWVVLKTSSSIDCLPNKQPGILLESVFIPNEYFQPYRGWLPTSEVIFSVNKEIKT